MLRTISWFGTCGALGLSAVEGISNRVYRHALASTNPQWKGLWEAFWALQRGVWDDQCDFSSRATSFFSCAERRCFTIYTWARLTERLEATLAADHCFTTRQSKIW